METRHFILEAMDGPATDGTYQITAKDVFTFTSGDRAQAPALSNGYVGIALNDVATTIVLQPPGVGAEYPSTGYINIGGDEIAFFTNAGGDLLDPVVRGAYGTTAAEHEVGARVQVCYESLAGNPADVIYDLLVNYAGVPDSYIPYDDWIAEIAAYLGETYTTLITEPKPVARLLSELIEQATLAMWWDDVGQSVRLQVLRPVSSNTATFDQNSVLATTLEVREQPEKRMSEVQVYFGKTDYLAPDDQENVYNRMARVSDPSAVVEYGSASIKKILSRWIDINGRASAETLANKQLGRYRDPPRAVRFDLMRDQVVDPQLGAGYLLGGTPFQDITGASSPIPIQITQINPVADHFEVEAEEMLWISFGDLPSERGVTLTSKYQVNLRDEHDLLYPLDSYLPIASGDIVNCILPSNVVIGSLYTSVPALDVGSWPAGVIVNLIVTGQILGCGGQGGGGGNSDSSGSTNGGYGEAGGTALYTRFAINLNSTNGRVWAGGGGGGGGGGIAYGGATFVGGDGGGGGAGSGISTTFGGTTPGSSGGVGGFGETFNGANGGQGTATGGGYPGGGPIGGAGSAGANGTGTVGGAGGAGGAAIDGFSFVTAIGAPGSIVGTQIN